MNELVNKYTVVGKLAGSAFLWGKVFMGWSISGFNFGGMEKSLMFGSVSGYKPGQNLLGA